MKQLDRSTFEISRELEFFTEKELQMQIGHGRELWPKALLKELIDKLPKKSKGPEKGELKRITLQLEDLQGL
jgi:hypothetical protein